MRWWVFAVAVALASFSRPLHAQEQKRYLTVLSEGYSRFEIDDGDVVAFFTGGVQCTYLGYSLAADELRYNRATQVALASGDVSVSSAMGTLHCSTISLDGSQGVAKIDQPLQGTFSDPALSYRAGRATLHFPPGSTTASLDDLAALLEGGVSVEAADGSTLQTDALRYEGASRRLTADAAFSAEVVVAGHVDTGGSPGPDLSHLGLTGASMSAVLDSEGGFNSVEITQALAKLPDGELSGGSLRLDFTAGAGSQGGSTAVELHGDPIQGWIRRAEETFEFSARRATLQLAQGRLESVTLRDRVKVDAAGNVLSADVVELRREGEAFGVVAPEGVHVEFDLAAVSGSAPVELPNLSRLAPRKQ
jgi:hypothetical protein